MNKNQSEDIKDLVASLAKAQGAMQPAIFNKVNPHFKSRYADFASCMDACRKPLSDNGLAIMQTCDTIDGKLCLITMLAHASGQWVKSEYPISTTKTDSQGIGSAMTYAKRYSLCGLLGVVADEEADEDDDGETSVGRGKQPPKPVTPPPPPVVTQNQIDHFVEHYEISEKGVNLTSLYIQHICNGKKLSFNDVVRECVINAASFDSGLERWSKKNHVKETVS